MKERRCPKCGSMKLKTLFIRSVRADCGRTPEFDGEHLHVSCECSYMWEEPTFEQRQHGKPESKES
jgi:hypothetical protein